MNGPGGPATPDPRQTQPFPRYDPSVASATGVPVPNGPGGRIFTPRYGNLSAYLLCRLGAFLVDIPLLTFVIAAFAFGALHLDIARTTAVAAAAGQGSFAFIALASFGSAVLFAILCEGTVGTSLGKALFGLHVFRARGGFAGLGRAIVRGLIRPVDLLVVGLILAAVTPKHQRIGDLAGGTTVARSPIGIFAPVIAAVLLAGIGYAQVAFGGGADSAIGVAAEASTLAPAIRSGAASLLAVFIPGGPKPSDPNAPQAGPGATASPAGAGLPAATPADVQGSPAATFPPGDESTPAGLTSPGAEASPAAETPGGEVESPVGAPLNGDTPDDATPSGASTPAGASPAGASPAGASPAGASDNESPAGVSTAGEGTRPTPLPAASNASSV